MQVKKAKQNTKQSNVLLKSNSLHELNLIESNQSLLIDARLLHQHLKVRSIFANWIKRRIEEFKFEENKDYFILENQSLSKFGKRIGGQNKIEYQITIDMAKELSMLERNDIGKSIRRYFIEAEKELRTKRLYASQSTLTEIRKTIKPVQLNGRKLYELRLVQESLGFSTKSSTNNVRNSGFSGLLVIFNRKAYVSEEYVKVMMASAKTKALRAEAKAASPVLPDNFGQLPLELKGGYHA